MISKKMEKLLQGNSAIRAMFEEGNILAAQYGRENVYDFSLGNPNFPAPPQVEAAIISVLKNNPATYVHGYMSNAGFPEVRAAVAESLNRRFATAYGQDNILMTVGAAGGLNVLFKTLLNPGDEVIVFAPYFGEYGNYVANFDGVLKPIPAQAGTFQPDAEALAAAITPRTRALLLNNPNNPTGVIYTREALQAVAAVLEEKQRAFGAPIYLIADEPYRELAYDGAEVAWLPELYRNTLVGYSWSKSLSLPGERIGYLVIPSEIDGYDQIWQAASIAGRVLGFVNAPSLMQLAVAKCLDAKTDVAAYDRNRQALYSGLTDCGFTCVYPSGAFYLWMRAPEADDAAFVQRAKAERLLLVPGSSFGGPGYVRLAYCVSPEQIARSIDAFRRLAAAYGLK